MDREELAARIDHTALGPETTPADAKRVLAEADEYGMNACIPPCYLDAAEAYPEITVATVVGFPHGQHAPKTKQAEAERAWNADADELDVVINVGRLHAGEDDTVRRELEAIVAAVPIPVKVIIEAPLLSDDEKRRACEYARDADADMVKTATGFNGGAEIADVSLMSEFLPTKASGGIGTYGKTMEMFDAGATRIGTSSGVAILDGFDDRR